MKQPILQIIGLILITLFLYLFWGFFSVSRSTQQQTVQTERPCVDKDNNPLSPEVCDVIYHAGTERPFSSPLNEEHRKGTFVSVDTSLPLFRSEDKYDSGTGWPSFTKPINIDNVLLKEDHLHGYSRTEVLTKDSGAHLGHVFDDGPPPLGKRWCMNGVALVFIPDPE